MNFRGQNILKKIGTFSHLIFLEIFTKFNIYLPIAPVYCVTSKKIFFFLLNKISNISVLKYSNVICLLSVSSHCAECSRNSFKRNTPRFNFKRKFYIFLQIQLQHYLKLLKTFRPGKKI